MSITDYPVPQFFVGGYHCRSVFSLILIGFQSRLLFSRGMWIMFEFVAFQVNVYTTPNRKNKRGFAVICSRENNDFIFRVCSIKLFLSCASSIQGTLTSRKSTLSYSELAGIFQIFMFTDVYGRKNNIYIYILYYCSKCLSALQGIRNAVLRKFLRSICPEYCGMFHG